MAVAYANFNQLIAEFGAKEISTLATPQRFKAVAPESLVALAVGSLSDTHAEYEAAQAAFERVKQPLPMPSPKWIAFSDNAMGFP